jgi:hypothetical protein
LSFVTIEPVTRVTPLGIRFRDEATGKTVRDGLTVTAGGVPAVLNPSDVYVFNGLIGLGASERGMGDELFWSSPPATGSYPVQVGEPTGRFQPFSFSAQAPYRGLLDLPCAALPPPSSPPASGTAPAVPLFSAPARAPEPGMAIVRAAIRIAGTLEPASYAVLEVDAGPGGPSGRGFADEAGRVLVIAPYPRPPSGLGVSSHSIEAASWSLNVRVRYVPGAATGPYPDLCAVLGQPPAVALATHAPDTPMSTAALSYGRELLLATAGHNVLLVT